MRKITAALQNTPRSRICGGGNVARKTILNLRLTLWTQLWLDMRKIILPLQLKFAYIVLN